MSEELGVRERARFGSRRLLFAFLTARVVLAFVQYRPRPAGPILEA